MLPELQVVSTLGPCFGGLGVVFLAKRRLKQQDVTCELLAVKKVNVDQVETKHLTSLLSELLAIRQLRHPCLPYIQASLITGHHLYLVSPLAGYGSCADLIANHFPQGLHEHAIALILRDTLSALQYLHSHLIIHRAVRARHILVNARTATVVMPATSAATPSRRMPHLRTPLATLTNLRHAIQMPSAGVPVHQLSESDAGNLNWLSPELLAQDIFGYDEKSDIYSVGITALELATGIVPFSDCAPTCMLVEKLSGCWLPPQLKCNATNQQASGLQQLIKVCTLIEPHMRPSAQQLLLLDFFKSPTSSSSNSHVEILRHLLHPVIPLDDAAAIHNDDDNYEFNDDNDNEEVQVTTGTNAKSAIDSTSVGDAAASLFWDFDLLI